MLERGDEELRGLLTRLIARTGFAPEAAVLAREADRSEAEVVAALHRLADARALLLHPGSSRPWIVHPFALAPASCWVEVDLGPAERRGYWASCLYCAFGIAAALRADAVVTTRYGGEAEAARFEIARGALVPHEGVFHLSTPFLRWWDNVIFACASFQPFRTEADVDAWCARHALPKGAVMTLDRLWRFAGDWYGAYVAEPWRKRSPAEVEALFARHALDGPFWSVRESDVRV